MEKNKLLILAALKAEASPFIEHYKLRKKEFIGSKFIYYSKTIALLITGVGKTNVQNTLETYCSQEKIIQHDFIINVGVAGASASLGKIGDLFFINKIIGDTGGTAYPNLLYKYDLNESSLTTVNNPVVDGNNTFDDLVDMEALYIWNILTSIVPNDRFIFLKVISDYMDNKCLDIKSFNKLANNMISYQLIPITRILNTLQRIEKIDTPS